MITIYSNKKPNEKFYSLSLQDYSCSVAGSSWGSVEKAYLPTDDTGLAQACIEAVQGYELGDYDEDGKCTGWWPSRLEELEALTTEEQLLEFVKKYSL